MIVSPDNWPVLWETIEQEMQDSPERNIAVIFSVHEVETVCAVKMLQVGLKTHTVAFSTYPVVNHSDLQHKLAQLLTDSQEMRTVVLLNCGASTYVPELAPPSAANVRYIVIDSHRPVDVRYNNADDIDAVFILSDDDPLPVADIPPCSELDLVTPEQMEELLAEGEAEAEAEAAEAEDAGSLDSPAKRQRLAGGEGSSGRPSRACRDRLRLLQERQRLMAAYRDLGSSYGKPSPLVVLPLAELLLSKCDNSLLWPAAVGLTDQWVHQRLSNQHHELWYKELADAVAAADANYAAQQQQQQQRGGRLQQDARADSSNSKQPMSQARLVAAKDYRLMLFRHWTLFDAFCFSPYVAPRLQTWRPGGKEALSLLFAHMGLSIEQAKTEFNSMQSRSHRMFTQQLERALLKTNLAYRELAADGFQLHHSRKVTAASDMVHACTALLSEYTVSDTAPQDDASSALGFWHALDALDCHTQGGWNRLLSGIRDAKMLQQAIVMDGGIMVADRKLQVNLPARLQELNLVSIAPTNASEFRHPLTLLRLAQFVRDATKVARQGSAMRVYSFPIMVIGPEDGAGWCIVTGLRANILADNAQYNIFGRTFEDVLLAPDSEVRWDDSRQNFDTSVVYVHKESLHTFCSEVRLAMIASVAADAAAAAKAQAYQQAQQQQQQQQGQQHGSQQGSGDSAGGAADDTRAADDRQRRGGGSEAGSQPAGGSSLLDSLASGGGGGAAAAAAAGEGDMVMVDASDDEEGGGAGDAAADA